LLTVYSCLWAFMKALEFQVGRLRFRQRAVPTVAAIGFVALTISLGNWQTHRAEEKLEAARRLDDAAHGPVLSIPSVQVDARDFRLRRVAVRGRFVARATIFLDNKVLHGVAGYDVLTPLAIEGGDMHVLVDRGWIAAADRSKLPEVPTPEGPTTIEGIAAVPSPRIFELAPESDTGPLRENLVIEREQKRLALRLQHFVIEQTSEAHDGLERAWPRPDSGADRNRSYALQWYSFAALAAVLYAVLGFRRGAD